jgi:hypothetical protein
MAEAPYNDSLVLELPVELRCSAEIYALKHKIDLDTVIERAITQFLDNRE